MGCRVAFPQINCFQTRSNCNTEGENTLSLRKCQLCFKRIQILIKDVNTNTNKNVNTNTKTNTKVELQHWGGKTFLDLENAKNVSSCCGADDSDKTSIGRESVKKTIANYSRSQLHRFKGKLGE